MYRCIEECYPGHLIREGELVEEQYAFPRRCFEEVPEGTTIEVAEDEPQLVTNAEIVEARAKIPIAGTKRRAGRPRKEA